LTFGEPVASRSFRVPRRNIPSSLEWGKLSHHQGEGTLKALPSIAIPQVLPIDMGQCDVQVRLNFVGRGLGRRLEIAMQLTILNKNWARERKGSAPNIMN
jgi:hypothetical protein